MAVTISFSVTQNSQSIADNTTNVTVRSTVKWTGGSYNATGECYGSITIDGTKYSFSGLKFNTGKTTSGSQTIMTKTVNVKHNSDGTKTLKCSTSFYTGVSSGTISASANTVLKTIPQKSTLTASNGTLGTAQTLTINRKASGYTHTIKYECGSASGTIATKTTSTSVSFTPPLSLASQNTTGTTVSVKFTITTYNGTTSLGSNTKTITCSIPSSVKPSCSISVSDAAGLPVFVKGVSKFKITVTPTIAYGSEIASYTITTNGMTYTSSSVTTSVISSSGSQTIKAVVKDKRGRTAEINRTLTVYDIPSLSISGETELAKEQTISVTDLHQKFHYSVSYTCGSVTETICENSTEQNFTFTPLLHLANQGLNTTSVPIKYTITSYCGNIKLGSESTTVTYTIPDDVAPTVVISYYDNSPNKDRYGAFVKGKSRLSVSLAVGASYGAGIMQCEITVGVQSKSVEPDKVYNFYEIRTTENLVIEAIATDTRKRSGRATETVTGILDYVPPDIGKLTVGRCDVNGTPNEQGEYTKATFSATVTPLNNINKANYKISYKKTSDSQYTSVDLTELNNEYSVTNGSYIFPTDSGYSYDVMLTVNDDFSESSRTTSVSTGFVIVHYRADGKGIAFGKVSELSGVVDIGFQTLFTGGIRPAVLMSGADFDTVMIPNIFAGETTLGDGYVSNYVNAPSAASASFVLEVIPTGSSGQLMQRLTICSKGYSRKWERHYHSGSWAEWFCTYSDRNTVLWSGAHYMHETQIINLSEPVSKQPTGIILRWSACVGDNVAASADIVTTFVPKEHILSLNDKGVSTADAYLGIWKYVYVSDTLIRGYAANANKGTINGVAYDNTKFVLREVIGV